MRREEIGLAAEDRIEASVAADLGEAALDHPTDAEWQEASARRGQLYQIRLIVRQDGSVGPSACGDVPINRIPYYTLEVA